VKAVLNEPDLLKIQKKGPIFWVTNNIKGYAPFSQRPQKISTRTGQLG